MKRRPMLAIGLLAAAAANAGGYPAPVLLERVQPHYPKRALREHVEGFVELELEVLGDGRVGAVRVIRTKPKDMFEEEAVAAVRAWRFEPSSYPSRRGIQVINFKSGDVSYETPREEWPEIKETPDGVMIVPRTPATQPPEQPIQ